MTTLTSLDSDVVDIILSYNDISFEDIINLRCVCKHFRWIAKTDEYCFYKIKFSQRWPCAENYYNQQSKENFEQNKSKKDKQENKKPLSFIEFGIDCVTELHKYILEKEREKDGKSVSTKRKLWDNYMNITTKENYIKLVFYMDESKYLLTQPQRADCDLTKRDDYYGFFDLMRLTLRYNIIERYIQNFYPYKELLEESVTILAQQLQLGKNVIYSNVKASLNNIALEARHFLRERHPKHSIFSTADEYLSYWENNKIYNDYWNETEGTQIMDTLEEYMFGKLNFRPTYSKELEYMCIDYVLKNKYGNELILYIIYHSVARRLGLRCDVVYEMNEISPGLFWIPKDTFTTSRNNINVLIKEHRENVRYFDVSFDKFPDCLNKDKRFTNIYLTSFVEMMSAVIQAEYNLMESHILSMGGRLTIHEMFRRFEDASKLRSKKVKFAVGMIVTHGDESTDCSTGVIIGWHQNDFSNRKFYSRISHISNCVMPLKMCSNFNATGRRTYYLILSKCDKLCYVEEDAVTLAEPRWIENRHVYRYFLNLKERITYRIKNWQKFIRMMPLKQPKQYFPYSIVRLQKYRNQNNILSIAILRKRCE